MTMYETILATSRAILVGIAIAMVALAGRGMNRYLDQRDKALEQDLAYKAAMWKLEAAKVHCDLN